MSFRKPKSTVSRKRIENQSLDLFGSEAVVLKHSIVTFECGPAGVIARIDRTDGTKDYAGPVDSTTVETFREFALVVGQTQDHNICQT